MPPQVNSARSHGTTLAEAVGGAPPAGGKTLDASKPTPEDALRTDHLLPDLKGRAISGGLITTISQVFRFAIYMASTMILARILAPRDFGLVAMVGALVGLLRLFREGGLSTATVRQPNITHAQVSNLFWINTALGAFMALICAALAPVVAWFYRDPRLVGITIALSGIFLFSGASVQPIALLNRQMEFKKIAIIDIVSLSVGLAVGVGMALLEYGYWSLVGMQLTTPILEAIFVWGASHWRPQVPRLRSGTRGLVNFGASLTGATLLRRIADSTDTFLLGRFFGADAIGYYSRGMALLTRPMDQFIGPFDAVFVPLLSRLQGEPDRYRSTFLKAYNIIALLSFPIAALLLALAQPLVHLLLGPQWDKVTPIFASFSMAALFIPLGYASMWLPVTQGRSRDILIAGVSFSVITIIAFSAGIAWGPVGVALAFSLSGLFIRLPVQYLIVGRSGPVRTIDLWGVLTKHLGIYVAVFGTAWFTRRAVSPLSPFFEVAVSVSAGLLAAIAAVACVPAQRALAIESWNGFTRLIRSKLKPVRKTISDDALG